MIGPTAAVLYIADRDVMTRPALLALLLLTARAPAAIPTVEIRPTNPLDLKLVARGQTALTALRIAEARMLLQRPADDGVAEAARLLAETYDQVRLEERGVWPAEPTADIEEALRWYKRAAELGDDRPGNRYAEAMRDAGTQIEPRDYHVSLRAK